MCFFLFFFFVFYTSCTISILIICYVLCLSVSDVNKHDFCNKALSHFDVTWESGQKYETGWVWG